MHGSNINGYPLWGQGDYLSSCGMYMYAYNASGYMIRWWGIILIFLRQAYINDCGVWWKRRIAAFMQYVYMAAYAHSMLMIMIYDEEERLSSSLR